MTDEQIKALLDRLARDGIWLARDPEKDTLRIKESKLIMAVPTGLRYLLLLHSGEIVQYLQHHKPPTMPANYYLGIARTHVNTWLDVGFKIVFQGDHLALIGLHGVPAPQVVLILARLAPEIEQALRERGTPIKRRRKIPAELRRAIIRFHDFTCQYCQRQGSEERDPDGNSWHIDHTIPVAFGGNNDPSNLVLSCQQCNLRKGSKGVEKFLNWQEESTE